MTKRRRSLGRAAIGVVAVVLSVWVIVPVWSYLTEPFSNDCDGWLHDGELEALNSIEFVEQVGTAAEPRPAWCDMSEAGLWSRYPVSLPETAEVSEAIARVTDQGWVLREDSTVTNDDHATNPGDRRRLCFAKDDDTWQRIVMIIVEYPQSEMRASAHLSRRNSGC